MKNVLNLKFILIIISVFFFINLDVKGATRDELSKYNISVSKEDSICVYSPSDGKAKDVYGTYINNDALDYIVFKFVKSEQGENTYQIVDLTLNIDNNTYDGYQTFVDINGSETNYVSSSKCSDYAVDVQTSWYGSTSYYLSLVKEKNKSENSYTYNINATNIVEGLITITEPDNEVDNCKFQNKQVQLGTYVKDYNNIGHFVATDGSTICPASVLNKTSFTRIAISLSSFKCEAWQLVTASLYDNGESLGCDYFLVDADSELYTEGTKTELEGDYITKYVAYRNDAAASISIIKEANGGIKAVLKDGKKESKIEISNISSYSGIFLSNNKEEAKKNYPKYLHYYKDENKNDIYMFLSTKDENAKRSYISITELSSFNGFDSELAIETCESLLGNTFLDFLNNNVVKIIYIGIPILLILLTSFDFAKVVFIDDKEGIQGAAKKFGKRAIIAILIYLIPTILVFLTNIFASNEVKMCVEAFKGEVETSN